MLTQDACLQSQSHVNLHPCSSDVFSMCDSTCVFGIVGALAGGKEPYGSAASVLEEEGRSKFMADMCAKQQQLEKEKDMEMERDEIQQLLCVQELAKERDELNDLLKQRELQKENEELEELLRQQKLMTEMEELNELRLQLDLQREMEELNALLRQREQEEEEKTVALTQHACRKKLDREDMLLNPHGCQSGMVDVNEKDLVGTEHVVDGSATEERGQESHDMEHESRSDVGLSVNALREQTHGGELNLKHGKPCEAPDVAVEQNEEMLKHGKACEKEESLKHGKPCEKPEIVDKEEMLKHGKPCETPAVAVGKKETLKVTILTYVSQLPRSTCLLPARTCSRVLCQCLLLSGLALYLVHFLSCLKEKNCSIFPEVCPLFTHRPNLVGSDCLFVFEHVVLAWTLVL